MKLRTRIILTYTILITLAFGVLFVTLSNTILKSTEQMIESSSSLIFEAKAQEAGSWIKERVTELQMIAMHPAVQSLNSSELREYVHNLNMNVGQNYGNEWGTFAIGGTDGIGWVSNDQTIDVSEREYFQEAITSSAPYILSSPVTSKTDSASIALICYPLKNEQGTYGFINGAMTLNRLTRLVSRIDFYEGYSWIMDSKGNHYTEFTKDTTLDNLAHYFDSEAKGTNQFEYQDTTLFYTLIPNTEDWYLCCQVENSVLYRDVTTLQSTLILIWMALLSVSVLVSLPLSRFVTQPVLELTQTIQQASQNLSIRAKESGSDEVKTLAKTFNFMIERIESLMKQTIQDEKIKRKAELQILQAQINPHFLYNTLDMLNWMAYDHGDKKMTETISDLSGFYRISLSKGDEFIPVQEEIKHIQYYLNIQKRRFEDMLDWQITVDEQLKENLMLKILLQPIVENAILHGIRHAGRKCTLNIHATQQETDILFTIEDDGIGISEERLSELRNSLNNPTLRKGFGLINVHERIVLTYGQGYGLTIDSEQQKGTRITLRIPVVKKDVESTHM